MTKDKEYMRKYRAEYKTKAKTVSVVVTLPMYEQLEKLSKIEDKKISTLIRENAFANIQKQSLPTAKIKEYLEELKQHTFIVRNIANNINQIAHRSNTLKILTQEDEHSLLMEIKKLEDAVKEYTKNRVGQ